MNWFGKDWGSQLCKDCPHTDTPVGQPCAWCEEPFVEGDEGVIIPLIHNENCVEMKPYHLDCHLRTVTGSLAHVLKICSCFVPGSTKEDPPDMTKREAAWLAVKTCDLLSAVRKMEERGTKTIQ